MADQRARRCATFARRKSDFDMNFHSLRVRDIAPETADTATIEFEVPAEMGDTFRFKPGQHLTVRLMLDGQEVRRSYSMSSAPHENRLAITVKKVPNGKVSTYLHDWVQAGRSLDVSPPEGRFTMAIDPEKRRTYYLFAAGSGITPVISIAKELLEQEPMCTIYLLYGSRDEDNIIFRETLDRLSERYGGQMNVEYLLSRPKKESGSGLFSFFKRSTSNWQGKIGRIDARAVDAFLDEFLVQGPEDEAQYFICGPGTMADTVKNALLARTVGTKQIHTEHFVDPNHTPGEAGGPAAGTFEGTAKLVAHLKGRRIETSVQPGMTILDALIREKHDAPYSCTAGACATCMAKVLSGKVKMDACYALDDEEVRDGYVLTCQSRPETEAVEISFDM